MMWQFSTVILSYVRTISRVFRCILMAHMDGLRNRWPPAPGFHSLVLSAREALGWRGRLVSSTWTRSEEHTSELQSLMRISYAVFCLKKKKNIESSSNLTNY